MGQNPSPGAASKSGTTPQRWISAPPVAWIDVPRGMRHPRARSERSDKYYVVVAGSVRFTTEGRTYDLGEGDVFVVPRGVSFEYENAASEEARLVLVHTPMFDADAEVLE